MTLLVVGLLVFLGAHSVRIFAEDWRTARVASMGAQKWKLAYTIVSIAGFALIVIGYGQARAAGVALYTPPPWGRAAASLLTLLSFVLFAASKVPGTRIKSAVGHPMVVGVKVWAFAHLLANGNLADVVLFGAFLAWAVFDYIAARGRDRAAGTVYPVGPLSRDVLAVVIGLAVGAVFAMWLHGPLIGVRVA